MHMYIRAYTPSSSLLKGGGWGKLTCSSGLFCQVSVGCGSACELNSACWPTCFRRRDAQKAKKRTKRAGCLNAHITKGVYMLLPYLSTAPRGGDRLTLWCVAAPPSWPAATRLPRCPRRSSTTIPCPSTAPSKNMNQKKQTVCPIVRDDVIVFSE